MTTVLVQLVSMETNSPKYQQYLRLGRWYVRKYKLWHMQDDAMAAMAEGFCKYLLDESRSISNCIKWALFDFLREEIAWQRGYSIHNHYSKDGEDSLTIEDILCTNTLNPEQSVIAHDESKMNSKLREQVKSFEKQKVQYSMLGLEKVFE